MINQAKIKDLANEFLTSKKNKDKKKYNGNFVYSEHNSTLEKIFNINDDKLFEKLITANKAEMEKYILLYKEYLISKNYTFQSIKKLVKDFPQEEIFKDLLGLYNTYENFSTKWNYKIVDAIGTRTCLYCNREYIINYDYGTKRTTAELDHFYPRSLYPFLSISFFNLIPSCKTCNSKFKSDKDTFEEKILYPYQDSLNNNIDFKLKIKDTNFLNNEKGFDLDLETKNQKAENSKKLFKLQKLYDEHKDIVLELIQKSEIYSDSYIDELYQNYEGTLFRNREDVLRLITNGYVEDKDINKRPLSKLIKDISEELGLV